MNVLLDYAGRLTSRFNVAPLEIFAKILTSNDDSGKHGVLIPSEAYSFFPELLIADPKENATVLFTSFDSVSMESKQIGWKYYERYPERRITRLNSALNERSKGRRLFIIIRTKGVSGGISYVTDACVEGDDERFDSLLSMLFDDSVPAIGGAYVQLPVDAPKFSTDAALTELLELYDDIHSRGWIDTMRSGDTGIGYTFETLIGLKENNDQFADFKGIELKCKLLKDKQSNGGKINLFQLGPTWSQSLKSIKSIDRLKLLGQIGDDGRYSCYSQITTTPNNLGLHLNVALPPADIGLYKNTASLGAWARDVLSKRLLEKHSRAVFVNAKSRLQSGKVQYEYGELIYCERPDIDRFIDLVEKRRIVFEFTMSEKENQQVRNHGYPWRLVDARELSQLFALQVKLRG